MKKLTIFLLIIAAFESYSQQRPAKQRSIIISKNFYLIEALAHFSDLKTALPERLKSGEQVSDYLFNSRENKMLDSVLSVVYQNHRKSADELLDKYVRPSASYVLFHSMQNEQLWLKCWAMYYRGINHIINVYGLGKKGGYPDIDSASHDVKSIGYQESSKVILNKASLKPGTVFYEQPLQLAIGLLDLNNRDEAARLEPLEKGENKQARHKAKNTDFSKYSYTAILVPGEGPEDNQPLSEGGKTRCELVAEAYKNQKAPFIILSGGNVHPFQTPYNEALEMKKYLVEKHHIPASAIIIDPHARHTTTNFRNAGRYLIGYGFPIEKPALCITDKEQADYIMDPQFGKRNLGELGYLPYKNLKRISETEIEFFTVKETQFRDPIDPLDP